MSDSGTKEAVALELLKLIKKAENKTFSPDANGDYSLADREWILTTYGECISTIHNRWYSKEEGEPTHSF